MYKKVLEYNKIFRNNVDKKLPERIMFIDEQKKQ
jgi:hypothetical protein